jgi:hypothetical protein
MEFGLIEVLRNNRSFPFHALAFAWLLPASKPAFISFRAHHKNVLSIFYLIQHPAGPSFGRRFKVGINLAIYAL